MNRRVLLAACGVLALVVALAFAVGGVIFSDDWWEPSVTLLGWDVDPDWLAGVLLAAAPTLGAIGVSALVLARPPRRRHAASKACPQCRRPVAAGSPTCLGCGYNLVRR